MDEPRRGATGSEPRAESPALAVIVSTYERPSALEAVLRSLEAQTSRDFTVVIADDGSGPETREVVERWATGSRHPVRHVWQEDHGYRLAAIRNRAVADTDADYLVFIDGDCPVRPTFVERHARLAEPGRFVHGSRVRLGPELSAAIERDGRPAHEWSTLRWLRERWSGRIDRFSPLLTLPLGPLRRATAQRWQGVKGCNLALWRTDYLAVNGTDEAYDGWGFEDNDLVVRLIRHGVRRTEGRYAVTVLHLWHEQRPPTGANRERFERLLDSNATLAERGIERHL